jgi:hypothetical protein
VVLDIDNGEGVYFAVDSAVGKRVLSVDGQEQLSIVVQENPRSTWGWSATPGQRRLGLRKANYKIAARAAQRVDRADAAQGLEFLGFAQ